MSCFQVGVCSVVGEKSYVMFLSWGVLCRRGKDACHVFKLGCALS